MKTTAFIAVQSLLYILCATSSGQSPVANPTAAPPPPVSSSELAWFDTLNELLAQCTANKVLEPSATPASETLDLHAIRQSMSNLMSRTWNEKDLVANREFSVHQPSWPSIIVPQSPAAIPDTQPDLAGLDEFLFANKDIDTLTFSSLRNARAHLDALQKTLSLEAIATFRKFETLNTSQMKGESPIRGLINLWIKLEGTVNDKLGSIEPASKTTVAFVAEIEKLLVEIMASEAELIKSDTRYKPSAGRTKFFETMQFFTTRLKESCIERDGFPALVTAWTIGCNNVINAMATSLCELCNPTSKPGVVAKSREEYKAQLMELEKLLATGKSLYASALRQVATQKYLIKVLRDQIVANRQAWLDELRAEASVFAIDQLRQYDAKFRISEFNLLDVAKARSDSDQAKFEAHLASVLSIGNKVELRMNSTMGTYNATTKRIEPKLILMDDINKQLAEATANKAWDPAQPALILLRSHRLLMRGDFTIAGPAKHLVIACDSLEADNVRVIIPADSSVTLLCHRLIGSSKNWMHVACNGTGKLLLCTTTVPLSFPIQISGDPNQLILQSNTDEKKPWGRLLISSQPVIGEFVTNFWSDLLEQLVSWYLDSSETDVANIASDVFSLPRTVALPTDKSRRADELKKSAIARVFRDQVVSFHLADENENVSALVRYQNGSLVAELLPSQLKIEQTADSKYGTLTLLDPTGVSIQMLVYPLNHSQMEKAAKRAIEERIPGVAVVEPDWRTLALRWSPSINITPAVELTMNKSMAWDRRMQKTQIEFRTGDSSRSNQIVEMLCSQILLRCDVIEPNTLIKYGSISLPLKVQQSNCDSNITSPCELFSLGHYGQGKISLEFLNADQARFSSSDGQVGAGPLIDLDASTIEASYIDHKGRSMPSIRRSFSELSGMFAMDLPVLSDHTVEFTVTIVSSSSGPSGLVRKTDYKCTLPMTQANGVPVHRHQMSKSDLESLLASIEKSSK